MREKVIGILKTVNPAIKEGTKLIAISRFL